MGMQNDGPTALANSHTGSGWLQLQAQLNLGPKSAAMLLQAGITSRQQLVEMGSVAAYALVKQHNPRASLNLLWALEGAISNMHWQHVAQQHRTSLLLALESHTAMRASR